MTGVMTMSAEPYSLRRNGALVALGSAVMLMLAFMIAQSGSPAPNTPDFGPGDVGPSDIGGLAQAALGKQESEVKDGPLRARVRLTQGAIRAGRRQSIFAEIIVSGRDDAKRGRVPSAVAIVLDRSGSMSGVKIRDAKDAILDTVNSMGREDQVAFVAYNHDSERVTRLMDVRDARRAVSRSLHRLNASGGTNIPSGLDDGIYELRHAPKNYVRRVILFSDGLDGSGESLDSTASKLRRAFGDGVTVSALGIGTDYDETYMSTVAESGGGNYAFLAHRGMLDEFIAKEINEAANTVAEGVRVSFDLPRGVRFRRVLGGAQKTRASSRDFELNFGSISANGERRAIVELEVRDADVGQRFDLDYKLSFLDIEDRRNHDYRGPRVCFHSVGSEKEVRKSRRHEVWGDVEAALIDHEQQQAQVAWKKGRADEARRITRKNQARLRSVKKEQLASGGAPSAALGTLMEEMDEEMDNFKHSATSREGKARGLNSMSKRKARARRPAGRARSVSKSKNDGVAAELAY